MTAEQMVERLRDDAFHNPGPPGPWKPLATEAADLIASQAEELRTLRDGVRALCDEWDKTYATQLALMRDDLPYEVEPGIRHHLSMIGDLRALLPKEQRTDD